MPRAPLLLLLLAASAAVAAAGPTTGPNSTLAAPPGAGTVFGTDTNRQITIQARDSSGTLSAVTGGDNFAVDLLTSSPGCTQSASSPDCVVSCSPSTAPHTASYSCASVASRSANPTVHWAPATVTPSGAGTYLVQYEPEVAGTYDVSVTLLTQGGLSAKYYDNVWFVNTPVTERVDANINFQFGSGLLTTYGVDFVSVRWEGKLRPDYNETYTIYAFADDGVRVWIDKHLLIDSWSRCCNETYGTVQLQQNHFHDIVVEYFEQQGVATMELRWSSASTIKQIIPSTNLYYMTHISGSPFTNVVIGPGEPPNAAKSTASGAGLSTAVAGVDSNFTITSIDVFGNQHTAVTASTFSISFTPSPQADTSVVYQSNGQYLATVTANLTGTYSMSVKLDGTDIKDSPFTLAVSAGTASAARSIAYGAGKTAATAGVTAVFYVQVRDSRDNNRTVSGDTVSVLLTSGTNAISGTATYMTATAIGIYEITYTPTVAGTYALAIGVNGVAITGSPFAGVAIAPGPIHVPTSTASGTGIATATAGSAATFTIQAKDEFGNNLVSGSESFTVQLTGPATVNPDSVTPTGTGTYNVQYTPTVKGTYSLKVTLNSLHIASSPFTVVVSPGAAAAAQSTASGTALSVAQVAVASALTVQVKDSSGNNVDSGGHTVTAVLTCASGVSGTVTYSGSGGLYNVALTPTEASPTCSLAIQVGGAHVASSPFTVNVSPGVASAGNSTISGTGHTTATVGTTATFTIQAKDSQDNNHIAGGTTFTATLVGGGGTSGADVTLPVTDNGDGTYAVSYTSTIAGSFATHVMATVAGGLTGKYYTDQTSTALWHTQNDAQINFDWGYLGPFNAGQFPADYFSVVWSGKVKTVYTETYTFYVRLGDNSGCKLVVGSTTLIDALDVSQGSTEPFGSIALTAGTLYDISLTVREGTGTAQVVLSWESASQTKQVVPSAYLYTHQHVASSPYTATVSPTATVASTTTCALTLPSSPVVETTSAVLLKAESQLFSTATVGTALSFVIVPRDQYGNLQTATGQQASYSVALTEVDLLSSVAGVVTNRGDGKYDVSLTPTLKGPHKLYVKFGGTDVVNSPFTVTVAPGPISASACTASGPGTVNATADGTGLFTITAKDASGNALSAGGDVFVAKLTPVGGGSSTVATVTDLGNGQHSVSYSVTTGGAYQMNVTLSPVSSAHISGSPFSVTILPGDLSGTGTALASATMPNGTANTASSFTVQAKDRYGNNHTAGGHQFYVYLDDHVPGSAKVRANVTDLGDGKYVVTYSTAANDYSVYVSSVSATTTGLTGTYYNNRWLQAPAATTRVDHTVNFDWGSGLITATASDYVSAQWTGYIKPTLGATVYTFYADVGADDGVRVFVDDVLVINQWNGGGGGAYTGTYTFAMPDRLYAIRVDYREKTGTAYVQLSWSYGGEAKAVIPTTVLFAAGESIVGSPFSTWVV